MDKILAKGPGRPRSKDKPVLSRQTIVAVALELLQSQKTQSLSMRKIAAELQTGPASLYVYYQDTAELYADVIEELFNSLNEVHRSAKGFEGINFMLRSYTTMLLEYPVLARSAAILRPSGQNYALFVERLLGLLLEADASDKQAAWGIDLLLLYATSIAAEQTYDHTSSADAFEETLTNMPAQHPNISKVGDTLFNGTGQQRFDWAIATLLAGILKPISQKGELHE